MTTIPTPRTKEQEYLYSILTNDVSDLPKPYTNEDVYLEAIAKKLGYLVSAKPRSYTIKTTDWVLGSDNKYTYTITHNLKSQDIIWNAWENSDGVLTTALVDAKLTSINTMVSSSEKNNETKIVINAIV